MNKMPQLQGSDAVLQKISTLAQLLAGANGKPKIAR